MFWKRFLENLIMNKTYYPKIFNDLMIKIQG